MAKKDDEQAAANPDNRAMQLLASALASEVRKKHGKGIITLASQQRSVVFSRISTGIFQLDYALGGGVPVGRVSTWYGAKSAAKTTVLLKTIADAQKRCALCWNYLEDCTCKKARETVAAFIDVEGVFDNVWAETNKVDLSRLVLSKPEYGEQALDIVDALLRSGECDVLALDSLAFLSSIKEVEESIAGDSWVVVKDREGGVRPTKIRELAEGFERGCGLMVRGFDLKTGMSGWLKLKNVWSSEAEGKRLFEIHTAYGRRLVCTGDHSLYRVVPTNIRRDKKRKITVADGELEEVKGSDVCVGDYLLADTGGISADDADRGSDVSLVRPSIAASSCSYVSHPSYRTEIPKLKGVRRDSLLKGVHGPCIPLKVAFERGVAIPDDALLYRGKHWIRPRVPSDRLAYLVGWFVGDGCFNGKSIRLYVDPASRVRVLSRLVHDFADVSLAEPHVVPVDDRNDVVVEVACSPLSDLFSLWFADQTASTKRVPPEVLGWGDADLREVLRGLLESDGSIRDSSKYSYETGFRMSVCTTSEGLTQDILEICRRLNIVASLEGPYEPKTVEIKQADGTFKTAVGKHGVYRVSWSGYAFEGDNAGWRGKRRTWIAVSDGTPVEVKSVEEVPRENVFDLEVEGGSPTFVANGLLVHNSNEKDLMGSQARMIGKGVRKVTMALNEMENKSGRKPTVLFTNQLRMKIGLVFGCFHAGTPVMFADGSQVPIGRVVREKLTGPVLSWDGEKVVERKICAWHNNGVLDPNERWLTFKVEGSGGRRGAMGFTCTGNHVLVRADGKEVPASSVKRGDCLMSWSEEYLTPVEKEMVIGSLFGDGGITVEGSFSLSNSEQADYLVWKLGHFSSLMFSNRTSLGRVSFRSQNSFELWKMRKVFYGKEGQVREGKNYRTIPLDLLRKATPLQLAVWFCDDGHFSEDHGRGILSVKRLTDSYAEKVAEVLRERFSGVVYRKSQRALVFQEGGFEKFSDFIADSVPASMARKLWFTHRYRAKAIPRQEVPSLTKVSCGVEVLDVRDSKKKHRSRVKYDLTVEENSFYLVGGDSRGVIVHNSPEVQPGGFSAGFAASTETRLSPGKFEVDEATGKPLFVDMNFKNEKNKTSVPRIEGTYRLILSDAEFKKVGDIQDEMFMAQAAEKYGVIEEKEGGVYCLGEKFDAVSQVEQAMMKDPVFKKKVWKVLMEVMLRA